MIPQEVVKHNPRNAERLTVVKYCACELIIRAMLIGYPESALTLIGDVLFRRQNALHSVTRKLSDTKS
jgi:hypothetical protein